MVSNPNERMCRRLPNHLRGFTLIEVLVAVAIIGILVALLIPAVQAARESARRAQCASNLRTIGQAIHLHAEEHGTFPAGAGGQMGHSYLVQILPQIEQRVLYDAMNFKIDIYSHGNRTVLDLMPAVFLCPSDSAREPRAKRLASNYAGNAGSTGRSSLNDNGIFVRKPLAPRDVRDGLSQTVGVSEWIVGSGDRSLVYAFGAGTSPDRDHFVRGCMGLLPNQVRPSPSNNKGLFWIDTGKGTTLYSHVMPPNHSSCTSKEIKAFTAGSFHGGGSNVLGMDGGVHFVKDSIRPQVWSALGSRSGGEVVELPL